MTRSKVLDKILKRLTPEKVDKMKQKRIEDELKLSAEYQFGYYVGEDIVNKFLPTTSVESGTRVQIEVSKEDSDEYHKIHQLWYDKYSVDEESDNEWSEYQKYREVIKRKYLPPTLKCYMMPLNITNLNEFKQGLISSLWNSDHCNYNLDPEKIKIYDDEDIYFTIIEFELD